MPINLHYRFLGLRADTNVDLMLLRAALCRRPPRPPPTSSSLFSFWAPPIARDADASFDLREGRLYAFLACASDGDVSPLRNGICGVDLPPIFRGE